MIKIIPLAYFFFILLSMPLSLSLIHSHLISSLTLKLISLNSLSQLPSKLDVTNPPTVPTTHLSQTHAVDRLRLMPLIGVLARGYWVPDWETHGARQPTPSTDPARWRCACLWLVIFYFVCDWWFCLVWVEEKDWRFGFFFFFFCLLWTGGGGGCDCGCGWW